MRILIDMEIESDDYGGREFKKEVEKIIKDIDPSGKTYLTRFKMRSKYDTWDPYKDIDWRINETKKKEGR